MVVGVEGMGGRECVVRVVAEGGLLVLAGCGVEKVGGAGVRLWRR